MLPPLALWTLTIPHQLAVFSLHFQSVNLLRVTLAIGVMLHKLPTLSRTSSRFVLLSCPLLGAPTRIVVCVMSAGLGLLVVVRLVGMPMIGSGLVSTTGLLHPISLASLALGR